MVTRDPKSAGLRNEPNSPSGGAILRTNPNRRGGRAVFLPKEAKTSSFITERTGRHGCQAGAGLRNGAISPGAERILPNEPMPGAHTFRVLRNEANLARRRAGLRNEPDGTS